jgi:hypothetical protein
MAVVLTHEFEVRELQSFGRCLKMLYGQRPEKNYKLLKSNMRCKKFLHKKINFSFQLEIKKEFNGGILGC